MNDPSFEIVGSKESTAYNKSSETTSNPATDNSQSVYNNYEDTNYDTGESALNMSAETDPESLNSDVSDDLDALGDIKVRPNSDTVSITIPASLTKTNSQSEIDKEVKEKNCISGSLNPDGSATYVMDKATYEKNFREIEQSLYQALDELANSEELPNIDSIEPNSDFSTVTVYVNSKPGLMDAMASMSIAFSVGIYHIFKGDTLDDLKIEYVNSTTGELYNTQDVSDVIEEN